MGKRLMTPKDVVRVRSQGRCEKCGVILVRNVNGLSSDGACRSIHHREPKRERGRDSVVCMVQLCLMCHRAIHADEDTAALDGWIVIGRNPASAPFKGWKGWILPVYDGSVIMVDFETGRMDPVPFPSRPDRARRSRHRVAERPQYDRRRKMSRKVA